MAFRDRTLWGRVRVRIGGRVRIWRILSFRVRVRCFVVTGGHTWVLCVQQRFGKRR